MKKNNHVDSRKSTIRYEMIREFMLHYTMDKIPEYTDQDKKKKMEIFQIKNLRTCIITGMDIKKNQGDHLFEVRGYKKQTNKYGIESHWNMIPVCSQENKKYKKYDVLDLKTGKVTKKDIGYQDLTKDELSSLSKEKLRQYHNIKGWLNYCKKRGVKLGWEIPKDIEEKMEDSIKSAFSCLEKGLESMRDMVKVSKSN